MFIILGLNRFLHLIARPSAFSLVFFRRRSGSGLAMMNVSFCAFEEYNHLMVCVQKSCVAGPASRVWAWACGRSEVNFMIRSWLVCVGWLFALAVSLPAWGDDELPKNLKCPDANNSVQDYVKAMAKAREGYE